jgi:WD40 repeat protein
MTPVFKDRSTVDGNDDDDDERGWWMRDVRLDGEHSSGVKSVHLARARVDGMDGWRIAMASASADGEIRVRTTTTATTTTTAVSLSGDSRGAGWEPLARLRGHDGGVKSVRVIGSRCDRVLSASYDRSARVWTLPDASEHGAVREQSSERASTSSAAPKCLRGHGDYVVDACWASDARFGEVVVTACADGKVRVWSIESDECVAEVDVRTDGVGAATCVDAYCALEAPTRVSDECVVVSARMDGSIRFFHARTGTCALVLLGHLGAVTSIATPDALPASSTSAESHTRVSYGTRGGTIGCFSVHAQEDGASVAITHLMHRETRAEADLEGCTSIKFISHLARTLASSSEDGTVRIWDVQRGRCTHVLTGQAGQSSIETVSMLDDVLACGSSDGTVSVWRRQSGGKAADAENGAETTLSTRADIALRWLLRKGPAVRVDEVDEIDETLLSAAYDAADREAKSLLAVSEPQKSLLDAETEAAAERVCGVCHESLFSAMGIDAGSVVQLPCAHAFHGDCVLSWMKVSHQCPLCREVNYDSGVSHVSACIPVARSRELVTRVKSSAGDIEPYTML